MNWFGKQKSADYATALFIAGPLRGTCKLWPGQPLPPQHRPGDLIAIKGGLEWVVMVAGDTPTPQASTVRRLIIDPKPDPPKRSAIFDNYIDVARSLAAGLVGLGFEATAFATEAQLEAALQFDSFDACVIVSFLPNNTDEALVAKLRSQNDTCPIALLTGKGRSVRMSRRKIWSQQSNNMGRMSSLARRISLAISHL